MAGAAKQRANHGRHATEQGSSSGDTSSSGKATHSAKSHAGRSSASVAHSTGSQYDGNRDSGSRPGSVGSQGSERNPDTTRATVENKNLDIGTSGWSILRPDVRAQFCARGPPSKLGNPANIALNTHEVNIDDLSKRYVYQYDVLVGSGTEKRGLIKRVWASKRVQNELGSGFIYDGNKLAWSMKKLDREVNLQVDLDAEEGRQVRAGAKENKHRMLMRFTNCVRIDRLIQYLEKRVDFTNSVLESINFLDHMLRETPAARYTQIKRSFFARGEKRYTLGNAVEAFKGVYSSMRIVHGGPGSNARLSINVDVANGTFWTESLVHSSLLQLTGMRDINDLIQACKREGEKGRLGKTLKKMRKLHVTAHHRRGEQDHYVIEKFVYQSAKDTKFEKDGKIVSIYDYFAKTFNIRLQYPDLPLVKMTKGKNTMLPMEVLKIDQNQRYVSKLDERQTSNMIKFAVEPPPDRWTSIQHGLKMLQWDQDPVIKAFGVKVNPNRTVVNGRIIPAPTVRFGQGEAKPGTSGRWDLKGKKFLQPNPTPLKSWAVCVIPGRRGGKPDKAAVQNFITEFVKIYQGHGGRVENKTPAMSLATGEDVGAWVTDTWNKAGNQANLRPQILVFILPDKDATTYGRIKRSAECRYGVVSQCMQYAHVQKCQAQYISNVCMKFNAKLGGSTCRAVGPKTGGPTGVFSVPTVVIGADVSHAAPGSEAASMAALTMSMDQQGIRYAATAETNGYRVEMISTDNINSMLKPMFQYWTTNVNNGKFPQRIVYFRDGVSEGQYQHVLEQEVRDIKALIKTANPAANPQFLVIVGGKRHHVRFFPEKGDRNGNPLPGTLVESGVTHPYENDFYLCSHAAIKGTARPVHYQVLMNEAKMPIEEIQTLIYEQCYQYLRATTPVSMHPAVYYAHIVSNRAIPHDPQWAGSSDGTPSVPSRTQSGSHGKESSSGAPSTFMKLMPMPNQGGINTAVWYI